MISVEILCLLAFASVTVPALLLRRGTIQQTMAFVSCGLSVVAIIAAIAVL